MATFMVGNTIWHPIHGRGTVDFVFASSGRVGIAFEGDGYLLLKADRLRAELDGESRLPTSRLTMPVKLKKPSLRALLFQARMTAGSSLRQIPPLDAEQRRSAAVDAARRQLRRGLGRSHLLKGRLECGVQPMRMRLPKSDVEWVALYFVYELLVAFFWPSDSPLRSFMIVLPSLLLILLAVGANLLVIAAWLLSR